ncbi:MAG TPA: pentapeptide repeat-containing protein [Pyrinomonadaceae bacterium]|nr:pentapeptide repeat-containing protein [Pyrinomonadaceae bacterium]
MPSSPPTEAPAAFVCDCKKEHRSACKGLPVFNEHEGRRYCVLHYPGKDKSVAFNKAFKRKLDAGDFDFRGVWFPDEVDFIEFTFTKPADFSFATFTAQTNFYSAKFDAITTFFSTKFDAETYFGHAMFHAEARFDGVKFGAQASFETAEFRAPASFSRAEFGARASFDRVKFGGVTQFYFAVFGAGVSFDGTEFTAVGFDEATFKDYARFAGDAETKVFGFNSSLSLQFARIEKPERFSFHTLTLRPDWFINVDARKFEFINVDWGKIDIAEEIAGLTRKVNSRHRLFAIACRNLAVNAEENHRYEEASRLRYAAMNVRRRERGRGFAPLRLNWWYWLASGYGERAGRAFLVLLGVWLLSALLYTQVGFARWEPRLTSEAEAQGARRDATGRPLELTRALAYSAGVMTLQKPEPRPATTAAHTLVLLETILGPLQAALLALAIRRKFMR